jgi:organic hydroperoxide reductase OsmC/OhrA
MARRSARGRRSRPLRPRRDRLGLGGFGLGDEPLVDALLEAPPEIFTGDPGNGAGTTGLELHRDDRRIVVAVATGITLGFRQRAEAPHDLQRTSRPGRQNPHVSKELRYAIDLRDVLRTEDGTPLDVDPAWSPEHLLLAALLRCSLKSLDYHARRAGNALDDAHGSARALIAKRESDGRYATTEIELDLEVRLRGQPGDDELAALLQKAERDCFVGASLTVKPVYTWSVL